MKVHMIIKAFNNGASVVSKIFSSKAKAEKYLQEDLDVYKLDGYDVSRQNFGKETNCMIQKGGTQMWFTIKSKEVE
jgi:hypothetical protein